MFRSLYFTFIYLFICFCLLVFVYRLFLSFFPENISLSSPWWPYLNGLSWFVCLFIYLLVVVFFSNLCSVDCFDKKSFPFIYLFLKKNYLCLFGCIIYLFIYLSGYVYISYFFAYLFICLVVYFCLLAYTWLIYLLIDFELSLSLSIRTYLNCAFIYLFVVFQLCLWFTFKSLPLSITQEHLVLIHRLTVNIRTNNVNRGDCLFNNKAH